MTPERWKQIDELAQLALEHGAAERAAFLDEACAGDEALRREVESQIAYQQQASKFLEEPAFKHAVELMADPQTETAPMEGRSISHYSILRKLGEGGMGEVYLAQDTTLSRKVAIKFLSKNSVAGEQARKRFVREARAAAALDHPHICAVYEVGEEAGYSFIVMQYVEGETLASHIQRQPIALREALDIAVQIADALAEAHSHRIIHRDIKPQNVMLTASGQVKVLDFGLARVVHERSVIDSIAETESVLSVPGSVIGTVPYMSPEQVRGEELDGRSDIFSFGTVLYEMISGHQPFLGESAATTISAILTREPPLLARYSREVPAELERIVEKTLHKDREGRYQTAKDLLIDLKSLKHRFELEAERERSKEPGSVAATGGQAIGEQTKQSATPTRDALAPSTTRIEYVITWVRWYKLPFGALALALLTLASVGVYQLASRGKAIDSVAILPFVNVSADPNTEYLSDGITDSLISNLSQLPELKVMSRNSAFRYKGREIDPQAVGRELKVQAVLTGRLVQRGEGLSISLELVDVRDNRQLWGEQYNRKISDLIAVQQDISREIIEKLRLKLSGGDKNRLIKRDASNTEAYQFYLKGRYYWNKRTAESLKKAIEQFQQAIDRDPTYPLAFVGLADCYLVLGQYAGTPSSETLPKAKAAVLRALEIDDSLAEAHASLGKAYEHSWQFEETGREYKRAIELNPNYPTAHHWYSQYLVTIGRLDDALAEIKRAQQLDPISPVISAAAASTYLRKGDLDAAIVQCNGIIELDPTFPFAHACLGRIYQKQGRYGEAIGEFRKAVEVSGNASENLSALGYCYAISGRRSEAMATLKELEGKYAKRESAAFNLAAVYAGLGEKDQAFAWLEKDFQSRSGTLFQITFIPTFDTLRSDARYADLLRRMGLRQ